MSSLMDELAKRTEEFKIAYSKPFRMEITRVDSFIRESIWLSGTVETGVLRVGEMIRLTGESKPDITLQVRGLMLGSGPKNEIFPWGQEVAIIVEGVKPEQFEKGMIVTRIEPTETPLQSR